MRLEDFSSEQVISFCFSEDKVIENEIKKIREDFMELHKKEVPSQLTQERFYRKVEILEKCKSAKKAFMNELLG